MNHTTNEQKSIEGGCIKNRKPENIEEMADALVTCINNNSKDAIRESIINAFTYLLNKKQSIEVKNIKTVNEAALEALSVLSKVLHALQSSNMKGTILHNEISDSIKKLMAAPLKIPFKSNTIIEPIKMFNVADNCNAFRDWLTDSNIPFISNGAFTSFDLNEDIFSIGKKFGVYEYLNKPKNEKYEPIKEEELMEQFIPYVDIYNRGYENTHKDAITTNAEKCVEICKKYAASLNNRAKHFEEEFDAANKEILYLKEKLNNTVEDKWIRVEDRSGLIDGEQYIVSLEYEWKEPDSIAVLWEDGKFKNLEDKDYAFTNVSHYMALPIKK